MKVNSEWNNLRAVMLYLPGRELSSIRRPVAVQHLRKVHLAKLRKEIFGLAAAYRQAGIKVYFIKPRPGAKVPPNLVFVRDLFFNTAKGFVLSRMAGKVRPGEEKFAADTMAELGMKMRLSVTGRAVFEGADALWLDSKTVLCGVGNRTNRAAFAQLSSSLRAQGVKVHAVAMPSGVQHLLGILQLVSRNVAVVREEKIGKPLARLLVRRGYKLIGVPECAEITERLGMNFVTVRAKQIIMAKHCPQLRRHFESNGIRIIKEVEISQLINAAGGIACATGILARRTLT